MIIKRAYLSAGHDEPLVRIVTPGLVKTSALSQGAERFISTLRPRPDITYALVNAMGYSEFYGANSNADWYGYNPHLDFNGLLHAWPDIGGDVEADAMKGKAWPYGYPCFYNAAVFAHHKNTDPQQLGFGDVCFVGPNAAMKRIELVMRVSNAEAMKKGHDNILARISAGERVDCSMGCKVPFDLCLHPSTLVKVISGNKPAHEIEVGDQVLTHQNRYRRITQKFVRHTNEYLVCVQAAGVPVLQVTENHPMFVVRGEVFRACKGSVNGRKRRCSPDGLGRCSFCERVLEVRPEWIDASEIHIGDYLVAPVGAIGNTEVELPKARLLGYWLGDGHRLRQRTGKKKDGDYRLMGFVFTVAHREENHLERLLRTIVEAGSKNEPNVYESGANRKAYQVHTYDQPLAEWLVSRGSDEHYNKRLAEEVFSWSKSALLEFIGGWIDTDGHFDKERGLVRVATSRRELALDGQRVLRLLGVPSIITTSAGPNGEVYQFSIQPDYVVGLELWKYSDKVERIEKDRRGGCSALIVNNYALHPVRAVGLVPYEGSVINFSVEEDESYTAEGVVTHNCSICTDWAAVHKAWKTFDPARHRHPGVAILAYHKTVRPIRGLAVTRTDYCSCMLTKKGKILDDGSRVFVYNDFPRFFDISFVWIGADRTARVMWFLGHPDAQSRLSKTTSPNTHALSRILDTLFKGAGIEKEIPDGVAEAVHRDAETSPEIGFKAVVEVSGGPSVEVVRKVLTTLGALGIVPTPKEFQSLVLSTTPGGDVVEDALNRRGAVFDASARGLDSTFAADPALFSPHLASALSAFMPERSSFAPFLMPRLKTAVEKTASRRVVLRTPLLDKIAAQYNTYRASVLENAEALFPKSASYLGPDIYMDKASMSLGLAGLLLALAPVIQLVSSHLAKSRDEGKELGAVSSFIADNPTFSALTTVGAAMRGAMAIESSGGLGAAAKAILAAVRA